MTEISSSIATYPPQHRPTAILPAAASPTPNGSLSDTVMQDDTEDYTIKCICSYKDDDGSTVLCEKCETWQHIICYYQGKKVPDVHCCDDCDPRQLDAKRATENQKRLRELVDHGDRKAKRPPQKSHKKKNHSIATAEQINGCQSHARRESVSAARDQPPPAKRAKMSHRASTSIASMNGSAAPPEPRKRAVSNVNAYPSPVKSPSSQPLHPPIPMYSSEFLSLYEHDKGKNKIDGTDKTNACSNSMSMAVTNDLTTWHDSPSALQHVTGRQHDEVFHQSEQPLMPHSWPQIQLREKKNAAVWYNGHCPKWKYVVLETNVQKDDFIGEIKGDIGRLGDYCLDPGSRWNELRHPEPFVFFHPQMPIYIDSRAEGTQFRYVRRSCHPNVSLKTFVTGERDFHHCFVAKENIAAGTELTAMWYIDQTLFDNGKVKEENGDEEEPRRRATYFSRILSNFGDCACGSADCWLKNFDLRTPPELPKRRSDPRRGRGKAKTTTSPSSTGQATNSRAGSENVQPSEEEDHADSRSTSDSTRSKPQSRDNTPGHVNQLDPADELSQRDKKKIQMVERAFEEQQSKKQKPKRKRNSGGVATIIHTCPSKTTSTSAASLPTTPNQTPRPPDLNTASLNNAVTLPPRSAPLSRTSIPSPSKLSSSNTPSPLSYSSSKVYVDYGMQTEPDPEETEEAEPTGPATIPGYESYEQPHMRRIRMYKEWERRDRVKKEEMKKRIDAGLCSPFASIVPTWLEERRAGEQRRADRSIKEARDKKDRVAILSPNSNASALNGVSEDGKSDASTSTVQLPPPPLPSQAAHTQISRRIPPGPKLQLSTLPPVPPFAQPASSVIPASIALTSTPTTPSIPHSPFSHHVSSAHPHPGLAAGMVAPSPVRKKLSLGDYISRRSNLTTPVAEKPPTHIDMATVPAPALGTGQGVASPTRPIPSGPAPVESSSSSSSSSSPSLSVTATKQDQTIKLETEEMGGIEVSSAVTESAVAKDERTTIALSVPAPAAASASAKECLTTPSIPSELSSVLSNLQALAGDANRRNSGGEAS